ncbi:MAG: hypothetical protein R2722_00705 [Tessaracoccus sp.]
MPQAATATPIDARAMSDETTVIQTIKTAPRKVSIFVALLMAALMINTWMAIARTDEMNQHSAEPSRPGRRLRPGLSRRHPHRKRRSHRR